MQCTVFAHVVRQQDYANQFRYEILFSNRTVCNVKPIHRSARNFRFFDHHQSSNAVVLRIYKYKNNFKITWRGIENAKWKKKKKWVTERSTQIFGVKKSYLNCDDARPVIYSTFYIFNGIEH